MTSNSYSATNPHPSFDTGEYLTNHVLTPQDAAPEKIFTSVIGDTAWDGGDLLTINPQAPDVLHYLVFEISNVERYHVVKNKVPLPTWMFAGVLGSYCGYLLEVPAQRKSTGSNCPANLFLQLQSDMTHELDGYGFTAVTSIPTPDPDNHECVWFGRDWSLHRLRTWQRGHGFGRHLWVPNAQSRGGQANSEAQRLLRDSNARLRKLNARVSDLRAYAMDQLGWDPASMSVALGIVDISKKLRRVRCSVPQLTPEEIAEAILHAETKNLTLSPWLEFESTREGAYVSP